MLNFPEAYYYLYNDYKWDTYKDESTMIWYNFKGDRSMDAVEEYQHLDQYFYCWPVRPLQTSKGRLIKHKINHIIIVSKYHPEAWGEQHETIEFKKAINTVYHLYNNNEGKQMINVYDNYSNFYKATMNK